MRWRKKKKLATSCFCRSSIIKPKWRLKMQNSSRHLLLVIVSSSVNPSWREICQTAPKSKLIRPADCKLYRRRCRTSSVCGTIIMARSEWISEEAEWRSTAWNLTLNQPLPQPSCVKLWNSNFAFSPLTTRQKILKVNETWKLLVRLIRFSPLIVPRWAEYLHRISVIILALNTRRASGRMLLLDLLFSEGGS